MKRRRVLAAIGACATAVVVVLLLRRGPIALTTDSTGRANDEGTATGFESSLALRSRTGDSREAVEAETARQTAARAEAPRDVGLRCVEYPDEAPIVGARFRALDRTFVSDSMGHVLVAKGSVSWIRSAQDDLSVLAIDDGDRTASGTDPTVWCVRMRTLRGRVVLEPQPEQPTVTSVLPMLVGDDLVSRRLDREPPPGGQGWLDARKLGRAFEEVVVDPDGSFSVEIPDAGEVVLRVGADGYGTKHVLDVRSVRSTLTVELRRDVVLTGRVLASIVDESLREGRDAPPIPLLVSVAVQVPSFERATALSEPTAGASRDVLRRRGGGAVIRTTRQIWTDGAGTFRVVLPRADAASICIRGRLDSRQDLGRLASDRSVDVALPTEASAIRRVRLHDGGSPLEAVVHVHEIVEDVDLADSRGTGPGGEVVLCVREGRAYVLWIWDAGAHRHAAPRFLKRWTVGPESVVDVRDLPDAPIDES